MMCLGIWTAVTVAINTFIRRSRYHWDNTNACLLKNTSACPHMCSGNVCGLDGELFGWGAKNYPRLVARMKEIGAIIAGNNAVGA